MWFPPLLLFWESDLSLMEMYPLTGQRTVSQHGTFTQGGPGESGGLSSSDRVPAGRSQARTVRAFCCGLSLTSSGTEERRAVLVAKLAQERGPHGPGAVLRPGWASVYGAGSPGRGFRTCKRRVPFSAACWLNARVDWGQSRGRSRPGQPHCVSEAACPSQSFKFLDNWLLEGRDAPYDPRRELE